MSEAHLSTANYSAVIADLRAKRDELDRTIALLEAMARVSAPKEAPQLQRQMPASPTIVRRVSLRPPIAQSEPETPRPKQTTPTPSVGIGEVCMRVLREAGRPLSTRKVTDAVLATGFQINTQSPVNNVWSALSHRMKVSKDVAKSGRDWVYSAPYTDAELEVMEAQIDVNGAGQYVQP